MTDFRFNTACTLLRITKYFKRYLPTWAIIKILDFCDQELKIYQRETYND